MLTNLGQFKKSYSFLDDSEFEELKSEFDTNPLVIETALKAQNIPYSPTFCLLDKADQKSLCTRTPGLLKRIEQLSKNRLSEATVAAIQKTYASRKYVNIQTDYKTFVAQISDGENVMQDVELVIAKLFSLNPTIQSSYKESLENFRNIHQWSQAQFEAMKCNARFITTSFSLPLNGSTEAHGKCTSEAACSGLASSSGDATCISFSPSLEYVQEKYPFLSPAQQKTLAETPSQSALIKETALRISKIGYPNNFELLPQNKQDVYINSSSDAIASVLSFLDNIFDPSVIKAIKETQDLKKTQPFFLHDPERFTLKPLPETPSSDAACSSTLPSVSLLERLTKTYEFLDPTQLKSLAETPNKSPIIQETALRINGISYPPIFEFLGLDVRAQFIKEHDKDRDAVEASILFFAKNLFERESVDQIYQTQSLKEPVIINNSLSYENFIKRISDGDDTNGDAFIALKILIEQNPKLRNTIRTKPKPVNFNFDSKIKFEFIRDNAECITNPLKLSPQLGSDLITAEQILAKQSRQKIGTLIRSEEPFFRADEITNPFLTTDELNRDEILAILLDLFERKFVEKMGKELFTAFAKSPFLLNILKEISFWQLMLEDQYGFKKNFQSECLQLYHGRQVTSTISLDMPHPAPNKSLIGSGTYLTPDYELAEVYAKEGVISTVSLYLKTEETDLIEDRACSIVLPEDAKLGWAESPANLKIDFVDPLTSLYEKMFSDFMKVAPADFITACTTHNIKLDHLQDRAITMILRGNNDLYGLVFKKYRNDQAIYLSYKGTDDTFTHKFD